MTYFLHFVIMVHIYAILASSLDLSFGYGGRPVLCAAIPYGMGAYAWSLISVQGYNPCLGVVVAIVLTSALMAVLAYVLRHCEGDEFALATVGMQLVFTSVLQNWTEVTKGPYGVVGIPRPSVSWLNLANPGTFCAVVVCIAWLVIGMIIAVKASPFGRTLRAVRDDSKAATSLGKNPAIFHASAFILFGGFAAIAGILTAMYVQYIDPSSFLLSEAIFAAMLVILGGTGRLLTPVWGAAILIFITEGMRFLPFPEGVAANARQIFYGLLLICLMRFRPMGLFGTRGVL